VDEKHEFLTSEDGVVTAICICLILQIPMRDSIEDIRCLVAWFNRDEKYLTLMALLMVEVSALLWRMWKGLRSLGIST
jgi:hypothetical protein